MNEERFLEIMDEILDTEEELTLETVLDELEEWDSWSRIMFLAVMSDREKTMEIKEASKDAFRIGNIEPIAQKTYTIVIYGNSWSNRGVWILCNGVFHDI